MSSPRILLIDDHYRLIEGIRISLRDEGYEVFTAANGADGLKAARRHHPHVIVMDVNMPWMDGLETCRRIRQDTQLAKTPVIFLSSKSTVEERISGLEAGADDYLNKPFNTAELKARIRAQLRRTEALNPTMSPETNDRLEVGPLTLDLKACWVQVKNSESVQLTPAEFELLHYLMAHPNQTFTGDDLLENVWSYEPGTADKSLARWHIRNLRSKIEPDPANPTFIRTIPRHGYILDENNDD
ncbi:MAG: response regulator transcription factor [Anaerolineales bacterium]|nr:response regulator transcription factor [Anaerolineales bacterium]